MAEDAPSPRPTTEESASVETSENANDAPKAAVEAVDTGKPVVDAVVAETVGENKVAEEKEEKAKPNDDTASAPTDVNEGDKTAEKSLKKDDDKKEEDENKENATEPEAVVSLGLDGTADSKKSKKKSPATPAKATPKSAARKKSLANLKNNNTPSKPKNPDVKYEPGMQVLAKMRTFPPWPAVILSEELLPEALLKTRPSTKNPRTKGSSTAPSEERRHWPVIYMGTLEYSWINISNLDPLTAEKVATPPANIKNKGLAEAYNVAQAGFGLENVKELQASEIMDVDSVESDAVEEEPEEGVESMDVDEPESEEEKPKKKPTSKKRKLSVSDGEAEASEKPTKTPKKAAAKAKTPKTTVKTPKAPANGTAKTAAKPKASTVKKTAPPKSASKKKAPARTSKAKSAEKIDESDSEGEEGSSQITKEEEKVDPAEFQLKQVKALRGRLQRGFLDRNKPPVASDMADMAQKFDILEALQNQGIDAKVIKDTKIHKVLKNIIKLSSIPSDEQFNFKKRAGDLLARMNVVLSDGEAVPVTEKTLAVGKEKDAKDIKKPAEEKSSTKVEAVKGTKEDPVGETEKAAEKKEEPTAEISKKEDIEMRDNDEKEVGTEGDSGKAKVTEGEGEAVEASA